MPIIEFDINADGAVEMDGTGFQGDKCEKSMDPFIEALGTSLDDVEREDKPELLEQETATEELR